MESRIVKITRKKLKYNTELNRICGFLTPTESLIAINALNLTLSDNMSDNFLDNIKDSIKNGDMCQSWTYFEQHEDWR